MNKYLKNLSFAITAGALGGIVSALGVWLLGIAGLVSKESAVSFSTALICPKIIVGGCWGLLFLIPDCGKAPYLRGFIYSLFPTISYLFFLFLGAVNIESLNLIFAFSGFGLGNSLMTPFYVLVFNAVWGYSAAWWMIQVREDSFCSIKTNHENS